jgi:hypothetical protein
VFASKLYVTRYFRFAENRNLALFAAEIVQRQAMFCEAKHLA